RQEDDRRGGRDIEQQVVERRLICNTVAAADRRLAVAKRLSEQSASELRRVDEAETRREVVIIRLDTREDALVQWDVLPPEGRRGVLLALAGKAVEQVHRLSGVFVPNTQVERKVRADAPVVLQEVILISLAVGERGRTKRDLKRVRCVGSQPRAGGKGESAIDVRQERRGVPQVADVQPDF